MSELPERVRNIPGMEEFPYDRFHELDKKFGSKTPEEKEEYDGLLKRLKRIYRHLMDAQKTQKKGLDLLGRFITRAQDRREEIKVNYEEAKQTREEFVKVFGRDVLP